MKNWTDVVMPERIKNLPHDPERGYPIPFFVAWVGDKPDFRIADDGKRMRCVKERLCWICGERLGKWLGFVIGPMCAVNRVSAEPAMHRECAEYSVAVCPFLLNPNQKRNPKKMATDEIADMPGIGIMRNPGVMLLWVTTGFSIVPDNMGGWLIALGPPKALKWYAEGRVATRAEVMDSFESGLEILREMARAQGAAAERALETQIVNAVKLLPTE
jgi:hypothetical protein